jgi:Uma2 family endonuclease
MSQLKLSNIPLSAEEYFALDAENQDRYEFENGYVWSMAGTSTNHNRIVLNLALLFRADIKQKKRKCEIFTENIRLEVAPKRIYYYPDLIFTCNPTDLQDKIMMRSPSLIVEVLSNGSFFADLSNKTDNYLKMPSLLYYIVISQEECRARIWEKVEGYWRYFSFVELNDTVYLPQIDMGLPLNEVYENVVWEEEKNENEL